MEQKILDALEVALRSEGTRENIADWVERNARGEKELLFLRGHDFHRVYGEIDIFTSEGTCTTSLLCEYSRYSADYRLLRASARVYCNEWDLPPVNMFTFYLRDGVVVPSPDEKYFTEFDNKEELLVSLKNHINELTNIVSDIMETDNIKETAAGLVKEYEEDYSELKYIINKDEYELLKGLAN